VTGPRQRERRLIGWALEEGFDRAGVARLEPSDQIAALRDWLERGRQASMSWMRHRPEARADPRRLLAGARSALCVALQYHPLEGETETEGDLWPRVARYARGDDYHLLMDEGLRRLAARIEASFPDCGTRVYVDTGPLLERELAARAGLGAIGKNTNLLHPEGGSWFLLGELLLTLELEPGEPFDDLCGSCTACLDACPTGALPAPYELDSRRCISYWTIEHRGAVPAAMRRELGGWVFGCDVCQEVCPVNASPAAGSEPRLGLPPRRAGLDLAGLATLERAAFVERFRRSPMKRAKLSGLKRNAALAMGHRGEARYVEPLRHLLAADEDAVVRSHAAWALGEIGGTLAAATLRGAAASELDSEVRAEILAALERASR
jgi:epoxyqueuosine reductase